MEAILSRRSIRKYTSKPVPETVIKDILEAAMCAPSAGNERPWEFIVIKDKKTLEELSKVHPYAQMLKETSVAIVVCGDTKKEVYSGFWVQDCAAATENILIAATAKGLGCVWLGIYPMQDRVKGVKKLLGMPENVVPLSLVPLGYPAEKKKAENRFDVCRVHDDKW
jgi:nitroreductase